MYSSYRDRGLLIWVFLKQEPDCAKVKERSALTKEGALVGTGHSSQRQHNHRP